MNIALEELQHSLTSGFINHSHASKHILKPELLVNNSQGKKVMTTIRSQLDSCDSFWFSIAFVTTSGLACIKQNLIDLEAKNIKGRILVSQYLNFTQPAALKELLKFKNIEVRISVGTDFHAKAYLFNNQNLDHLIIGSSNLTAGALTSNREWNLKVSLAKQGSLSLQTYEEFEKEFNNALPVTHEFISQYELTYQQANVARQKLEKQTNEIIKTPTPNEMQEEALRNLETLRQQGANKALIISATGTGKTYLSAFDAKKVNPKRLLFIVHRANIAKKSLETYRSLFPKGKTFGLYSGKSTELEADFIFSTVQTLSRQEHLEKFDANCFDYIIIDETHRASAKSYQNILNYFQPKFLLGMTATPERTDGNDIYSIFDHNIAYEIRLQKASSKAMRHFVKSLIN